VKPRRSTYRLQLRAGFGFEAATGISSYLERLGVSDLYCSPILQATAGSTHGYDVVDHSRISSELGGEAGFNGLVQRCRDLSIGLTIDVVPNHMAIDGRANRWWWDVLENGPSSLYADYFDIDWPGDSSRPEPSVLVPVLGDRYGRMLERKEVQVRREGGSFVVTYFDHELPLSPRTADAILGRTGVESLVSLGEEFSRLPHAGRTDPTAVRIRHEDKERLRDELAVLCDSDPSMAQAVESALRAVNSDPDELDRLLRRQNYRLAYWKSALEELDYRRFFNIETLVALRAEDDQVFADTHETIGRLVRDGSVSGLRVDHVDGLADPEGYLQRLHRLAPDAYVVAEKILEQGEVLPPEWPIQGTTGYDFIARVSNAFVDPSGEELLTKCYAAITGELSSYPEVVRTAKLQIMTEELAPEVERLTRLLHSICDNHRDQRDRTPREVREALHSLIASFPVYRTYVQPDRALRPEDAEHVETAVRSAREMAPDIDPDLLGFIGEVLLLAWPGGMEAEFARRFPQVSAPVMAKGAEDTAFYRYNRLVSLNEVGGSPGVFGRPLADFHAGCSDAAQRSPRGMLALATHDTKRSADVRSRISLLSEIPDQWEEAVTRWMTLTDRHAGGAGPDYNCRYLFLQTLVGTWPIETPRLVAYMQKASKEAKVYTSWVDPNADYDDCLTLFVRHSLSDKAFVEDLEKFLGEQRIVELGRATSLSQVALLLTCPGVPDIYQGSETWDYSLVDPDNRRPVDFTQLQETLSAVKGKASSDADAAKLWLTARLLDHRRARPELYDGAPYEELVVEGREANRLIAFGRGNLVVVAARHLAGLDGWGDTTVELPAGTWRAVVGGEGEESNAGRCRVESLLAGGSVSVMER
jgi:(1->4)-alpha-D-glucan 1-alpha-D-glucosylmutase